uniref:Beta-porphyranase A C-terminal domain-containing protein n=1 Tax=Rhodosorus marinus TaxID=101924 RepID=A0A7S0BFI9_9RHOD|mmetsp:Transcript_14467/g.21113  ORF Transcript_14467/g.21113 Transcript_14467/m.21113 type:complete len:1426 (+) Transcript_14467:58-4335(+)
MLRRYPEESEYSVVTRIGNICGQMCRDIKAANPDMLAGGLGANSGRPHLGNYSRWRTRMKNFIDSARSSGCVDFLSQHPYSSGGAVQDANLDLLETYTMNTSSDGKPIKYMVTETGAYHGSWHSKVTLESRPPTGGRNFIIMADSFKAFMSTIRVHDNLLKFINFLTLAPTHSRNGLTHPYPWSLTDGGGDDVLEWTDLLYYLELFKGVEGDFVYSYSDDPYVKVLSVANSNRGYVLLQNLATEGGAALVDLNFPFGSGVVESVIERKLWLEEGEPTAEDVAQSIERPGTVRWSNSTLSSVPENIQIEPEAMHVLVVTFTTPARELRKVERSRHYMGTILDSSGQARDYPVPVDANETYTFQFGGIPQNPNGVGYIRISHSRRLQDDAKPKVWVNDAEEPIVDYDERMAGPKRNYDSRYFGTFVIPYSLEDLGSSPQIKVQYSDDGGWLSSVILEVDDCVGGACCLLGSGTNDGLQCGTPSNLEDYPYRPPPNAEQLLKDPSFEKQDGEWSLLDGAVFQSSSLAFTGDQRLKLDREGSKAVQRVYLRENNVYRLHCYVRGSIRFLIVADSTVFGDSLGNTFPVPNNNRWRNQEFDFLIRDSGEYDVVIERDNGGTPSLQRSGVRADECSLYASANVPPYVGSASVNYPPEPTPPWNPPAELLGDSGLIRNPSFEFSTTEFRWDVTGPLQLTGQDRLEGTRAMIVHPGTMLNQTVFLDVDETYRLRCYVNGPETLTMEISNRGDSVSKNAFGPVTPIGYASWGYKDVVFVAPRISMDVFLYNDGDSECVVDFCTMFGYSGPITDPENEQLVQNPGFEQGTEPWLLSNGAEIRTFKRFAGVRGLRLAQEGSTAVQRVHLDGGHVYRWHCYSTGNIHFSLWKDSILYGENFGNTFPVPNSEWNSQEVDVMIEESGEYELTFVRDNGGVPSRQRNGVWVDDCSLYAAADGIPPYVGSGTYNLPDISPWDPPTELLAAGGETRNPSFEAMQNFRWAITGDLKFTVVNALIGERSMFIYPNTIATQLVYLERDERYRLRCYLRGPGSLTMEVSYQGARISKNSFGAVTSIDRGGWGYKDLIFDATRIAQDISLYNIGDSECVVDFCTLFLFSGPLTDPEYDSLLMDSSFEEDAEVWALSEGAQTATSESFTGTQALSLTQEGSKAVQLVALGRGHTYRFHCYVKGSIRLSIWRSSTVYAENLGNTFSVENSDWKSQEVDFEILTSADYEIVLERDDGGDPGAQSGAVWADDCSLYLATDGIPPYFGTGAYNLPTDLPTWNPPAALLGSGQEIRNPSFESWGNFQWTVDGSLKLSALQPRLGARALYVYPEETVARQTVWLDRGERYRMRCYVRGSGALTMEILYKGNRISKNSFGPVFPIAYGDSGYKQMVFDATGITNEVLLYNVGNSECLVDFCTLLPFTGALTDPELS